MQQLKIPLRSGVFASLKVERALKNKRELQREEGQSARKKPTRHGLGSLQFWHFFLAPVLTAFKKRGRDDQGGLRGWGAESALQLNSDKSISVYLFLSHSLILAETITHTLEILLPGAEL